MRDDFLTRLSVVVVVAVVGALLLTHTGEEGVITAVFGVAIVGRIRIPCDCVDVMASNLLRYGSWTRLRSGSRCCGRCSSRLLGYMMRLATVVAIAIVVGGLAIAS